jgi:hypothetical protein
VVFFDGDGSIMIKNNYYADFFLIGTYDFISKAFKYLSDKLELKIPQLRKRHTKIPNKFIYTCSFINKIGPHCYAHKIYKYLYSDCNYSLSRKHLIFNKLDSLCREETEKRYFYQTDINGSRYTRKEEINKEIRDKISISNQGNGPRGKLNRIGLSDKGGAIYVSIMKNGKSYCRGFENIQIATEMYDKMALYLYGNNATLNLPEKKYTEQEIQECFKIFTLQKKTSSNYKNISFDKKKKYWRAIVSKNKETMVKITCDEAEAAEYADIIKYIYFGQEDIKKLNFPEKIDMYKKVNKQDLNSNSPLRNFYKNV